MESCENCMRQIGKLETPHVHGGHVVCAECYGRLTSSAEPIRNYQNRDVRSRGVSGKQTLATIAVCVGFAMLMIAAHVRDENMGTGTESAAVFAGFIGLVLCGGGLVVFIIERLRA